MPARAHEFFWLSRQRFRVSQLIQEGFNRIDCAAGWGEPNTHWFGSEFTSFEEYAQLLPVSLDQWLPVSFPDLFPTPMYQDDWDRPAPEAFFTQVSELELDPAGLSDWFHKDFPELDFSVLAELQTALYAPHILIRLGYRLAHMAAQRHGVSSLAFQAAFCSIGVGCRGIETWTCEHCYRRTRGDLHYCDHHSQAKLILDITATDRSLQVQKSRSARKAAKIFATKDIPARRFSGYWDIELYEFELQVGGILWPLTGVMHQDWLNHVLKALSSAPLVKNSLSESFESAPNHIQIEQLQQAVGSREWVVSRWPALILLAETWLAAEKEASPSPVTPGLTVGNRTRVALAQSLLEKHFSHSQIADQLGISRSHLSHLLRRGGVNMKK